MILGIVLGIAGLAMLGGGGWLLYSRRSAGMSGGGT
jgi:LPXTG-motif cell wall-anchored protein